MNEWGVQEALFLVGDEGRWVDHNVEPALMVLLDLACSTDCGKPLKKFFK